VVEITEFEGQFVHAAEPATQITNGCDGRGARRRSHPILPLVDFHVFSAHSEHDVPAPVAPGRPEESQRMDSDISNAVGVPIPQDQRASSQKQLPGAVEPATAVLE
jgi:hypothetical protein